MVISQQSQTFIDTFESILTPSVEFKMGLPSATTAMPAVLVLATCDHELAMMSFQKNMKMTMAIPIAARGYLL